MSSQKINSRTRKDSRTEATRQMLIETAEALFGEYGIDSVSIRQIGSAIGSSNPSVVGYHFGTKDDLIQAIFRYRLPWLERRREEHYQALSQQHSRLELTHLLHAMWFPLFELVDDNGMHSFSSFLAELVRTGRGGMRQELSLDYPATNRISQEVVQLFTEKKKCLVQWRIGTVTSIITSQLRMIDQQRKKQGLDDEDAEMLFRDALAMAHQAITAPATASLDQLKVEGPIL